MLYIPKSMKKAIASKFYDKEVKLVNITKNKDEEGGVVWTDPIVVGSFKANVNFNNFGKIQEEYGLKYDINITLTTSKDVKVRVNDTIFYDSTYYSVRDVFERDSHKMIIATYQEW